MIEKFLNDHSGFLIECECGCKPMVKEHLSIHMKRVRRKGFFNRLFNGSYEYIDNYKQRHYSVHCRNPDCGYWAPMQDRLKDATHNWNMWMTQIKSRKGNNV